MQKRKKRTRIIVCSVLLFVALVVYVVVFRFPTARLTISEPEVDQYNNYALSGGDLCRVGNVLYYNYRKSLLNYGIAEITEHGSKRIYWLGMTIGPMIPLDPLHYHQNRVYTFDDQEYYDAEKGCFVDEPLEEDFSETDYGVLYYDGEKNKYYLEHNGKKQILMPDYRLISSYSTRDAVYAVTKSSKKGYRAIRKCDLKTQKVTVVGMIPRTGSENQYIDVFVVEDGYAVYVTDSGFNLYKIKLDNQSEPVKVAEDCVRYNAYNGKLYFSQSGKLIAHDLSTGENQILCKSIFTSQTFDPYIVDDTWVYFVSGSSTLWRVSNRGGKPQRIFG